jgi:branched-chain amino acid transport system ATP-binding protein
MALLEVEGLAARYGAVPALSDVSLRIAPGETLAVVGANGAGKTTLALAIAGALPPAQGRILFDGTPLAGRLPEEVARLGIALIPEGRRIFEGLTVQENLILGLSANHAGRAAMAERLERSYAMFPVLRERRHGLGTRLSGGEQQQFAIARALLCDPRLLILDEPSLGLAPLMVDRVYSVLRELRGQGLSMLLVEQNPRRVGELADRLVVLANGRIRMQGQASDLLRDGAALARAYLSAPGREER